MILSLNSDPLTMVAINPSDMVITPGMIPKPRNLKCGTHHARVCTVKLALARLLPT